jgi:hypothetical protein
MKTTVVLSTMMIVGNISSKEEANEITFIAKLFIVGQRARFLARNQVTSEDDEDEEEYDDDEC